MVTKPCTILGQRNSVTLLLVLYRIDECVNITSLLTYVSNYYSLRKCTLMLKEEGLIYMDDVSSPRPSIKIGLTEKGKAVASCLQSSADIISGTDGRREHDE